MSMLNEYSKHTINEIVGLSCDKIMTMDVEEITAHIEKRIGKKLTFFNNSNEELLVRGSVYMYLNRFLKWDRKKMNKEIDKIIKCQSPTTLKVHGFSYFIKQYTQRKLDN